MNPYSIVEVIIWIYIYALTFMVSCLWQPNACDIKEFCSVNMDCKSIHVLRVCFSCYFVGNCKLISSCDRGAIPRPFKRNCRPTWLLLYAIQEHMQAGLDALSVCPMSVALKVWFPCHSRACESHFGVWPRFGSHAIQGRLCVELYVPKVQFPSHWRVSVGWFGCVKGSIPKSIKGVCMSIQGSMRVCFSCHPKQFQVHSMCHGCGS